MEIIRFVLSNFWVWLGDVILILAIGQAAVEVIKAVRTSRKISAYAPAPFPSMVVIYNGAKEESA